MRALIIISAILAILSTTGCARTHRLEIGGVPFIDKRSQHEKEFDRWKDRDRRYDDDRW